MTLPAGWPVPVACSDGSVIRLDPFDQVVAHVVRTTGAWQPGTVAAMARHVHPGSLAVDAGAHIGCHTVALSRLVGPDGCVLAFEPEPVNRSFLHENLDRNGCANVRVLAAALGKRRAVAWLHIAEQNRGAHSMSPEGTDGPARRIPVRAVTLDDCLEAHGGPRPVSLLKLDVQGSEGDALVGSLRTLRRHRPAVLVECEPDLLRHAGSSAEEAFAPLFALGYTAWRVREPDGAVLPMRQTEVERFPAGAAADLLFRPPAAQAV